MRAISALIFPSLCNQILNMGMGTEIRRPTQAAILEDSRMDKMVDEGGSCGDLLFLWMV
jgi:hypothetical protein